MENLISFESFLSPAFIQLNDSYLNQRELFSNISSIMLKHGYVEKSYLNNVIEREKIYPTGLATPLLNIAIPHTDPIHIKNLSYLLLNSKNHYLLVLWEPMM